MTGAAYLIQLPPLVRQGVDLRLQGVILHGELVRRLNAIFHQILKLLLIAFKFDNLRPGDNRCPPFGASFRDGPQQIQVLEVQGAKAFQLPGPARYAAPGLVSPPRRQRLEDGAEGWAGGKGRRGLAGTDSRQPGLNVRFCVAAAQAVQPEKTLAAGGLDGGMLDIGPGS